MIKVSKAASLIPFERAAVRILAKVAVGADIEVEVENEFWKAKIARMNDKARLVHSQDAAKVIPKSCGVPCEYVAGPVVRGDGPAGKVI
jgi:hypothetical protein